MTCGALAVFMEAIEQARGMDRTSARDRAAQQFDTDKIVGDVIIALHAASLSGGHEDQMGRQTPQRETRVGQVQSEVPLRTPPAVFPIFPNWQHRENPKGQHRDRRYSHYNEKCTAGDAKLGVPTRVRGPHHATCQMD